MEGTPPIQQDPSVNPDDPNVAPTVNPVDNPDIPQEQVTPDANPDTGDQPTYIDNLYEAGQNLAPSEIPHVDDLPRLFGALAYKEQNGDYPEPLHERFPDQYPNPNE